MSKSTHIVDLRGGDSTYEYADALKAIYNNRNVLVALAARAKGTIGIPDRVAGSPFRRCRQNCLPERAYSKFGGYSGRHTGTRSTPTRAAGVHGVSVMTPLVLHCTFLAYTYQGVRFTPEQKEELDWPPAPGRLHQALMASALIGIPPGSEESCERCLKRPPDRWNSNLHQKFIGRPSPKTRLLRRVSGSPILKQSCQDGLDKDIHVGLLQPYGTAQLRNRTARLRLIMFGSSRCCRGRGGGTTQFVLADLAAQVR